MFCNQERCIIKTIFVAGSRTGEAISYKKLRKLLVDKKSKAALRMRKVSGSVTNIGHWDCGAVELYLQSNADFEKARTLIDQAFDENQI